MASKVFVSYRSNDSPHASGRLRDRLVMAFGEENVFFDVSDADFSIGPAGSATLPDGSADLGALTSFALPLG